MGTGRGGGEQQDAKIHRWIFDCVSPSLLCAGEKVSGQEMEQTALSTTD